MENTSLIMAFAVALSAASSQAVPSIVDGSVSLSQRADGAVVISYTLAGEPAFVTIDIQTNQLSDASGEWASIGGEGIGFLGGAANTAVATLGERQAAYWFPSQSFSGKTVAVGGIRAVVKAWPTNSPPDYMVVNLTAPTNTVRFYESAALLPGGFANLEYKTTKLVMRKIPAAGVVWRMGSPTGEPNRTAAAEYQHKVMLTEDYYAAIYETTQSQYFNMCGSYHNCSHRNFADSPIRAFNGVQYSYLRGQNKDAGTGYWPENGHTVTADSVIGKLRAKCGIADIDLPTDAQWEYACRAGTGTALPSGKDWTAENMQEVAQREYNVVTCPQPVGLKRPNAWGLYDTIGNVQEGCLDRYVDGAAYTALFASDWETGGVTVNPQGSTDTSKNARCVFRGGSWNESANYTRSAARVMQGIEYYNANEGYKGFRLFCSVGAVVGKCFE